jgi:hypothetical protein
MLAGILVCSFLSEKMFSVLSSGGCLTLNVPHRLRNLLLQNIQEAPTATGAWPATSLLQRVTIA